MYNTMQMQYNNYNTKTSFVPKSPATRGQRRVNSLRSVHNFSTVNRRVDMASTFGLQTNPR